MEGQIALFGVYEMHTDLRAKRLTGKPTLLQGANKEIWRGLVHWTNALNIKTNLNYT